MVWQIADAKNRFSELVTKALTEGPQRVRRRNESVIVLSEDDYLRLTGEGQTFKEFLLDAPDLSVLDLTRDRSTMRDIEW